MKKFFILSLLTCTSLMLTQSYSGAAGYYEPYGNSYYNPQPAMQTTPTYSYPQQNSQANSYNSQVSPHGTYETNTYNTQTSTQITPAYSYPQQNSQANSYNRPESQYETYGTTTTNTNNNTGYYTNWSDKQAQDIINNIGYGLKNANSLDLTLNFILVDEEEVNASTDIDNNVRVYKGILPYVEKEDELAFIIGHEMGHAASNHVIKGIVTDNVAVATNSVGKEVLRTKVTSVAASKLGGLGVGLGALGSTITSVGDKGVDAATVATSSTLQRGRENDADLLAIDYLVKKGYNPLAGISIMNKIGDVYRDLFVDHPSTDKRIRTMYEYISKNYPQYLSRGFNTNSYSDAISKYIRR